MKKINVFLNNKYVQEFLIKSIKKIDENHLVNQVDLPDLLITDNLKDAENHESKTSLTFVARSDVEKGFWMKCMLFSRMPFCPMTVEV